eukprot:sb/3476236/
MLNLEDLKKRKKLFVDDMIYAYRNLAWVCELHPSSSDRKAYDFIIRCLEPTEVFNKSHRVLAGEVTLSTPGKTISVEFENSPITIRSAIREDVCSIHIAGYSDHHVTLLKPALSITPPY